MYDNSTCTIFHFFVNYRTRSLWVPKKAIIYK